MKYMLLVLLLACSISVQAQVPGPPGGFIMPGCENLLTDQERTPKAGYCAGVINTIMQLSKGSSLICLPEGITTPELVPAILLWKRSPTALERDFIGLAMIALTVEFPCEIEDFNEDK